MSGGGKYLLEMSQKGERVADSEIKKIIQFEELVLEMRRAQKKFHGAKSERLKRDYLIKSKDLEKRVDQELERMEYTDQHKLFN